MAGLTKRPRTALALVLLLVGLGALVSAGCGSDADAEETTTTVAAAAPPVDLGTGEAHYEELVGSYLRFTEETPQEAVDAIESDLPLVILFYFAGSEDDARMRETVTNLQAEYPDVVFLTYEHSHPDSYGDLAAQLRVDYPPQMLFIKRTGMINSVLSGFADQGTVNQNVANII